MADANVLALTRYDALGASSRVRMLQYVPHLARLGVMVRVLPLLSNAYVESLYSGKFPDVFDVARSYVRRVADLRGSAREPVLWLEKELLPWVPFLLEQPLLRGRRVVLDCDDAVWLRYQRHANPIWRGLLGNKIDRLFACADVVTAGNRWIGDHARAAGARNVQWLPSVVDLDRYALRSGHRADGPPRIGWIGSPATVHYLRVLGPVLQVLASRHDFELVCVGGGMFPLPGVQADFRPWSADTEAEEIRRFDIGIMPLTDGEWERGKCGYKLIQYMACGVPVLGSRVGANSHIVTDGVDGLLAGGNAEWIAVLESLLADPHRGAALGAAGRTTVERQFSVQSRCAEVAAALRGEP